jgi:hypothetical protein
VHVPESLSSPIMSSMNPIKTKKSRADSMTEDLKVPKKKITETMNQTINCERVRLQVEIQTIRLTKIPRASLRSSMLSL